MSVHRSEVAVRGALVMARVLVTGGAGYVGSVCCSQLLASGHEVVVVDDLSTGHVAAVPHGAMLHQLDIGDQTTSQESDPGIALTQSFTSPPRP